MTLTRKRRKNTRGVQMLPSLARQVPSASLADIAYNDGCVFKPLF
jgi:hypothetical protein